MKLYDIKCIILGTGIGLVLSSIININIHKKIITDDFIKVEAAKRGFVIADPKDLINKEKIIDENINDKSSKKKEEVEEIKIEILKGYNSFDTVKILLDNGLVIDRDEFLYRLNERGKDNKIQYGSFVLKKNLRYDEIIDIITKAKNE